MKRQGLFGVLLSCALSTSHAATVAYYDEASFQSALDSLTLVDLDASPFDGFATPYNVQDADPDAAFQAAGISSFGTNYEVAAGNDFQTVKSDRDRLIIYGAGFAVGDLVFNLTNPVNGIGAFPNLHPSFGADGGEIIAFDGTGAEVGRVSLGQSPASPGQFSGLISDTPIASVEITCTFNSDLKCGVYDIQFGTVVPVPAAIWLFGSGLLGLIGLSRLEHPGSAHSKGVGDK